MRRLIGELSWGGGGGGVGVAGNMFELIIMCYLRISFSESIMSRICMCCSLMLSE